MDLILAIIPWKIIMNLQMQTKEKIGVALAMSMGVFAAGSAFIKCSSLPELGGRDFPREWFFFFFFFFFSFSNPPF